jgi:hypothetical protein
MISCPIDENILKQVLDQVPHIQELFLRGNFSHFNLDHLFNLEVLSLVGTINESFNIDLFKNLCNQLTILKFKLTNIEEKTFFKLFDDCTFPNLTSIYILKCNLKRLNKEFINRFPILINLFTICCSIEVIENEAFSNAKHLKFVDLSQNRLKFIEENTFSNLKNLETLDLSSNEIEKNLDARFIGVGNSVEFFLENRDFATFDRYWYGKK